jgi:hypothetical protein
MTDPVLEGPAEIVPVTLGAEAILGWARTTRPWQPPLSSAGPAPPSPGAHRHLRLGPHCPAPGAEAVLRPAQ